MNKKKALWYFSIAAAVVLFAVAITHLGEIWRAMKWCYSAVLPIVMGLCMAFVLNVVMSALEKRVLGGMGRSKFKFVRKIQRPLAIIITLLLIAGFTALMIAIIVPAITQTVDIIIEEFPEFIQKFSVFVTDVLTQLDIQIDIVGEEGINWVILSERIVTWLKENSNVILNVTTGVLGNVSGSLFNFIIAFMIAIYVLAGKEKIKYFLHGLMKAVFKRETVKKIEKVSSLTYFSFARFITGQVAEAVILGLMCFIGMLILGIPMAGIVSVIVGLTALIPIFGAWIGGAVGAFLIVMLDPVKAFIFVVFLLILQQIEGNAIYPKVVGESIGIPSLLVLSAVTIGGGVAGIPGILFCVPITSVVYTLLKEFIEKSKAKQTTAAAVTGTETVAATEITASAEPTADESSDAAEETVADTVEKAAEETHSEEPKDVAEEETGSNEETVNG